MAGRRPVSEPSEMAARTALAAGLPASATVAAAFLAVPRHRFLPGLGAAEAYKDRCVVIKSDADGLPVSAATQPAMMAVMLDQLGLAPGQRVLEIGTGTGYNAALLAHLVGDQRLVVTVEVDAEVAERARAALASAGYGGIAVLCTDGGVGAPEQAPFDRIIVTAGVWDIPPAWLWQLAAGGRIVLPLSVRGIQLSVPLNRDGDHWTSGMACRCGFIRVAGSFAGPESVLSLGPQPGLHGHIVDGAAPDAGALYRALSGPAEQVPTGLEVADVPELASLDLWLTLTEPGLTRMNMLGRHEGKANRAQRRIAGLLPLGGLVGAATGGALGVAAVSQPAGGNQGRPFEAVIHGYGPHGPALAARLARRATAWQGQGRPAAARLQLAVYPPGTEPVPVPSGLVLRRPHGSLSVGWPAALVVS
jgi:protein-L-isoaspartate(D-aspartate) O-methyltransferase